MGLAEPLLQGMLLEMRTAIASLEGWLPPPMEPVVSSHSTFMVNAAKI